MDMEYEDMEGGTGEMLQNTLGLLFSKYDKVMKSRKKENYSKLAEAYNELIFKLNHKLFEYYKNKCNEDLFLDNYRKIINEFEYLSNRWEN